MSSPKIIGLCGRMGSGKSTVANILSTQGFLEMSFAMPLKQICSILSGIDSEILLAGTAENRKLRETMKDNIFGKTGREWLEDVGMIFRQNFDSDFWVKILKRDLEKGINSGKKYIISDCRFENEYNMLKDLNADIWIIYKNPNDLIIRDGEIEKDHISRWKFIEFIQNTDKYIKNDRSKQDLKNIILDTL